MNLEIRKRRLRKLRGDVEMKLPDIVQIPGIKLLNGFAVINWPGEWGVNHVELVQCDEVVFEQLRCGARA
jgi:hypothetical protein